MKTLKLFSLTLVLFLFQNISCAQTWEIFKYHKNGWSSSWVNKIYAERNSTTWFGTSLGLNCLDSSGRWSHYTTEDGIPGSYITAIYRDNNNTLWVGTSMGLCYLEMGSSKFVTLPDYKGVFYDIFQDSQQRLWVGFNHGLVMKDTTGYWFEWTGENIYGLRKKQVHSIAEDSSGGIWIGEHSGYFDYIPMNGRVPNHIEKGIPFNRDRAYMMGCFIAIPFAMMGFLPSPSYVSTVLIDQDERKFMGVYNKGLYCDMDQSSVLLKATGSKTGLLNNQITCLAEDGEGKIWIGTTRGISVYQNGVFSNLTKKNSPLPGNWINDICVEPKTGNIWVATKTGAAKITW